LHARGVAFECVSLGEIEAVLRACPSLTADTILYTPNFAGKDEVKTAIERGVLLTIDNAALLEKWRDLLAGRALFLRLDPGVGRGHHRHVKTAGTGSKFGIAEADIARVRDQVAQIGATVVGLHAHAGSGILEPHHWSEVALFLVDHAQRYFPAARVLDLGGGLGVPEKPGQAPLDLDDVNQGLERFKQAHPDYQLWLEPGRFMVARAGALLVKVTQVKHKGSIRYVGVDAGMNALIRPALYGAYHEIVNLSRIDDPATMTATVVGPICESGDVLGYARKLAPTREGDVVLIGTTGAYGRVMSSTYNQRGIPDERLLS
jgi:diaminopimelate decarboxylase/aspartate kinase